MQSIDTQAASIRGMDLVGVTVKDAPSEIGFYRDVLGLTPTMLDPDGRGAEFELSDGTTFGIWAPGDDSFPLGMTVMFAVPDAAAAVARARERGAQVSDVNETPVCFMAVTSDPEGNRIILHQRKNP